MYLAFASPQKKNVEKKKKEKRKERKKGKKEKKGCNKVIGMGLCL